MNWTILRRSCAAIVLTMAACEGECVAGREGDGVSPETLDNGVLLNSFRLNSFRLNSLRLNSFRLNGDPGTQDYIQMLAVDLPGKDQPAHGWTAGSELRVVTTHGKLLAGAKLVGTRIGFTVQEDGVAHLREVWIAGVALPKPRVTGSAGAAGAMSEKIRRGMGATSGAVEGNLARTGRFLAVGSGVAPSLGLKAPAARGETSKNARLHKALVRMA